MKKKRVATKAELIADGTEKRLYRIEYENSKGEIKETTAQGHDMSSALKTVIRREWKTRLKRLPSWVWLLAFALYVGAFATAALTQNAPILSFLGFIFILIMIKVITDNYFKFVE